MSPEPVNVAHFSESMLQYRVSPHWPEAGTASEPSASQIMNTHTTASTAETTIKVQRTDMQNESAHTLLIIRKPRVVNCSGTVPCTRQTERNRGRIPRNGVSVGAASLYGRDSGVGRRHRYRIRIQEGFNHALRHHPLPLKDRPIRPYVCPEGPLHRPFRDRTARTG